MEEQQGRVETSSAHPGRRKARVTGRDGLSGGQWGGVRMATLRQDGDRVRPRQPCAQLGALRGYSFPRLAALTRGEARRAGRSRSRDCHTGRRLNPHVDEGTAWPAPAVPAL